MFKHRMKSINSLFLLIAPLCAHAAETTYIFDTVTAVDLHNSLPRIIGIEKDSGNPLDISFLDNTNISYRYIVNRCVPIFLTAIEKPGKYYLYLTVDPAKPDIELIGCRLELK